MTGGNCDAVMGSWYWIYWVGPFLAALAVSEVTIIINMDVGDESKSHQAIGESAETPEVQTLKMLEENIKEMADQPEAQV